MSPDLPEADQLLAAELAFGLIDGLDRQTAERRIDSDPAFARVHAQWQAYAAAMFSDPGEPPRPSVWTAIQARLPANDPRPVSAPNSLRWWRMGTLAASAAAIVLAVIASQKPRTVFVHVPVTQALAAPMVAVLTGKTGVVTISYDPASGRMISAASGLDIGDHSPELWVIPADGKPRSMGVMKTSAPGWAKVPEAAASAMAAGVTIAVTIEPIGGSPTGQPTGPVILTGKVMTT
jgi:anti-sigma-K factor RskA